MDSIQAEKLNEFFVHAFNQILAWEEHTLKTLRTDTNLSVREIHVIEAVATLTKSSQNTMANIAKILAVSPGSLTTSVNVLVNKGYLERRYTPKDRRMVYIFMTESGNEVNNVHQAFHYDMVQRIGSELSKQQFDNLLDALDSICSSLKNENYTKE